jgi:hypothetical protein
MTAHDLLRERLLNRAGLHAQVPALTYAELSASEWSHQFEMLMRNRLILGALRYGRLNARGKKPYDRIAGALKRLAQYQETGNTECLVDVANMMLLEFEEGKHPKKHWGDIHGDHCCV